MTAGRAAESRIKELGLTSPGELDIEAIAYDAGVVVKYETLHGCAATLVGYGDKAIATISPSANVRNRFSIGHEVGHWDLHRGMTFRCRVDDPSENLASDTAREKQADEYAAHLLMPSFMFNPTIKPLGMPGFDKLSAVAFDFNTSLIATAIRLADVDTVPVIVACYRGNARRWFRRAPHVPPRWWPKKTLDEDSFAHELTVRGTERRNIGLQSAETWFDNDGADEYEVMESCVRQSDTDILVAVYLKSGEMLDDR